MAPTTQQRPIQHSDAFRKTSGLAGGKVEKKTPPQQHLNMPAKKPITYSQIVNAETHSLTSGLEEIYNCSAYLGSTYYYNCILNFTEKNSIFREIDHLKKLDFAY